MRFAWSKAILAILVMFAAPAAAQVNPHTQIRWPAGCASANMVYSQFINNCISALGTAANPAGGTKQLQYNLGGAFAASANLTWDPATNTFLTTNISSGSVNTDLYLQAKFGASASQQTMSCTVVATSTTISSCTGGDFKSGQWIYCPGCGGTPTISAPSAPTLSCHTDNGGSCTGSVVYGYKIAAIQGTPNGAMTAASSATTITQAAQSAQAPTGSSKPDVYTTVTWSAVTSANLYAVYKSVNGGTYNFYTLFTSGTTTFNDFGFFAAQIFTCADVNIPCTAPSSAVPNDVFATITTNGAGSWTLSALPYPPKYSGGVSLNGSTTYPFTPATSGSFTIQHDDTPAFQTAWNYMNGGSNFNLKMGSGSFNLHGEDPYGRAGSVMHLNNLNHVTISGNGKAATQLFMANDRSQIGNQFLDGVCGYGSQNPPSSCQTIGNNAGGGGTLYALNDPVSMGAYSVTLATPANASNFPAGTYVNIGTNVTGYPQEMYAEPNLVTSSNSSTGVLTLAYQTTKPYSATLPAPYNNCSACQGTPYIGPVLPGPVATFIALKDFSFRGAVTFMNFNTIDHLDEENLNLVVSYKEQEGFTANRTVLKNFVTEDSFWGGGSGLAVSAQSSRDYTVADNVWTGASNFNGQPCSEGGTGIVTTGNKYTYQGIVQNLGGGPGNIVGTGAECYKYFFVANSVDVSNGNLRAIISAIDNHGIATISGNAFTVDTCSLTAQASTTLALDAAASSQGVSGQVYDNTWSFGTGGASCGAKASSNASHLPTVEDAAFTGGTAGGLALYNSYGGPDVLDIGPLTGNITSVNLGSSRIGGKLFSLVFIQGASAYTLPSTCASPTWATSGSPGGIACPQGYPLLNPAAGSLTHLWFYDDGTTVNLLYDDYGTATPILAALTVTSLKIGANTITALPASAVVGLTDTQTMTNKTVDGVSPTTFGFVDPTSSIQGQLNGKSTVTKITNSLTPAAATASSCVEQTFTYTGLSTAQTVTVSPPATLGVHLWIGWARVSAANTLAIAFCGDATAGTPPSGNYPAMAF